MTCNAQFILLQVWLTGVVYKFPTGQMLLQRFPGGCNQWGGKESNPFTHQKPFYSLSNVVIQFDSGHRKVQQGSSFVKSKTRASRFFGMTMCGDPTLQSQGSSGVRAVDGSGLKISTCDLWLRAQLKC